MKKLFIILIILLLNDIILVFSANYYTIKPDHNYYKNQVVDIYKLDLNYNNFLQVCDSLQVSHAEIVFAQGRLESSNFTSHLYLTKNNFLGMYNSEIHAYYDYDNWIECLIDYRDKVQIKWDRKQDYYLFLVELPYAMDPTYTKKVKKVVKSNGKY